MRGWPVAMENRDQRDTRPFIRAFGLRKVYIAQKALSGNEKRAPYLREGARLLDRPVQMPQCRIVSAN